MYKCPIKNYVTIKFFAGSHFGWEVSTKLMTLGQHLWRNFRAIFWFQSLQCFSRRGLKCKILTHMTASNRKISHDHILVHVTLWVRWAKKTLCDLQWEITFQTLMALFFNAIFPNTALIQHFSLGIISQTIPIL